MKPTTLLITKSQNHQTKIILTFNILRKNYVYHKKYLYLFFEFDQVWIVIEYGNLSIRSFICGWQLLRLFFRFYFRTVEFLS